MTSRKQRFGIFILASAIIWAAMMLGISAVLQNTGCYDEIQNLLIGGFIAHLFLIWGPLVVRNKKYRAG
jgi:hypothetical protein